MSAQRYESFATLVLRIIFGSVQSSYLEIDRITKTKHIYFKITCANLPFVAPRQKRIDDENQMHDRNSSNWIVALDSILKKISGVPFIMYSLMYL